MNYDEVLDRVEHLRQINDPSRGVRTRIRGILNGGPESIRALLGAEIRELQDLPAPNMIFNVVERTAQKLGQIPDVKILPPASQNARKPRRRAEKRERIVSFYDEAARLRMLLPQLGRWLPAYGFGVMVIREGMSAGERFPLVELRDPYDCYPGWFGPGQDPSELAVIRKVNARVLARMYPEHADRLRPLERQYGGVVLRNPRYGSWEGTDGVEVVTYYNEDETVVIVPEAEVLLERKDNVISGTHFVVAKRFAFDQLTGSYDQLIGIVVHLMKANMLELIAMEDAVHTETNVIGQLTSGEYRRGRFAVNYAEPGTRIEKPVGSVPYQLFQHIDRLERQFRLQANYPVTDDGQSPTQFATGRAVQELGGANSNLIREYQTVIADTLERIDAKRLEWDETMYRGRTKPLSVYHKGQVVAERYDPAEIRGDYRTQRKYGIAAGFDEPSKIVALLQLMQAGLIDTRTAQDNLDRLDNITEVRAGIRADRSENSLYAALEALAAQGDPRAAMTLAQILDQPQDTVEILKKFFTPDEPQMTPEEEALAGGGQPPGPPPDVQTLLSRLTLSGQAQGGVQTVGQL